jgi:hypothetical protein
MLALLFAAAPFAYATEGETEDADDDSNAVTTSALEQRGSNSGKGSFKDSDRFQELLMKMRGKLDKERSKMGGSASSTTRAKWEKGKGIASVDAPCVQKAVDTREVAVQSAFNKSNASISDALKARQTALYAAWGQSEVSARNVALKDAWKAWKDARTAASKTLKSERDAAWKTFRTTVKDTCKVPVPVEDESAGSDTAGQTAI